MSDLYPSRYIIANGLRFHYVETGPEKGPPVLMLHGFPEFFYSFRYQLSALGQAGFRAIAPDLRGYNLSDKPHGIDNYAVSKLCDDVVGLVKALGHKQVTLVGHDWGGTIAWAVASSPAHRHVVQRLIVLNSLHPGAFLSRLSPRQLRKSWYMLLFALPWLPEHLIRKNNFARLRRVLQDLTSVPGTFSTAELDEFVHALAQPGALTASINYYRAAPRAAPWFLRALQTPVQVPMLLLWGERDIALGKELTYNLSPWAANLRIEYLPDSGHCAHQEQPEQVNRLLFEFLAECTQASSAT